MPLRLLRATLRHKAPDSGNRVQNDGYVCITQALELRLVPFGLLLVQVLFILVYFYFTCRLSWFAFALPTRHSWFTVDVPWFSFVPSVHTHQLLSIQHQHVQLAYDANSSIHIQCLHFRADVRRIHCFSQRMCATHDDTHRNTASTAKTHKTA